ncbi:MAG: hypothetical protein V8T90_05055 [Victivallales bacterium]
MPELPTQEEFVRDVRSREIAGERIGLRCFICAGLLYLVAGFYFPAIVAGFKKCNGISDLFVLLFPFVFAVFIPAGIVSFLDPSRHIRCPHCRRKIKRPELAIALHACPTCHKRLFTSETFDRLELPRKRSLFHGLSFAFILSLLIFWICLKWISFDLTAVGGWVLIADGIGLLFIPIIYHVTGTKIFLSRNRKTCPVCGESYDSHHFRYTGNCSICGSKIDSEWGSDASMLSERSPTWNQLQTFRRRTLLKEALCMPVIFSCGLFLPLFGWTIWGKSDALFLLALAVGGLVAMFLSAKLSSVSEKDFDALIKCPCGKNFLPFTREAIRTSLQLTEFALYAAASSYGMKMRRSSHEFLLRRRQNRLAGVPRTDQSGNRQ